MCTPHSEYLALGKNDEARLASYRGLFKRPDNGALLAEVRRAVNQGLVLDNGRF